MIDEETRWIIEKIFDLAVHGAGASKIAKTLACDKVPTAGWLNYQRYGTFAHIYAQASADKAYAWTIAQVKNILKDETYIGNSIHNKQTNISYKNRKKIRKPKEEWFRVENTHEGIIEKEIFDQVQGQIANRRRQMKDATTQIFAGLLQCADCGWRMSFGTNKQTKTPYSYFNCTQYRQWGKDGTHCTSHYIRYDNLYAYVLNRLQYWSELVELDEEALLKRLSNANNKECINNQKKQIAELTKAEKRKTEVDRLFMKMYEDWSSEKITEYNFNMLSQKYQEEQAELEGKIVRLKADLSQVRQSEAEAAKWIELIKKYSHPTELTAELLNTLIEKIVIYNAEKDANGEKTQKIEIYYRFIGIIE